MELSYGKQKIPLLREFLLVKDKGRLNEVRKYLDLLEEKKISVWQLDFLKGSFDSVLRMNCLFAAAVLKAHEKSKTAFIRTLQTMEQELFVLYNMYRNVPAGDILLKVDCGDVVAFPRVFTLLPFSAYSFFGVSASLAVENNKFLNVSANMGVELAKRNSCFENELFGESFSLWLSSEAAEFAGNIRLRNEFVFDAGIALVNAIQKRKKSEGEDLKEEEKKVLVEIRKIN